jgi:ABC-type amino acid transport system permease subunit
MKIFLCLVLVIFSFVSHMAITPRLGVSYTYHPVLHYIGMLIGIGLLVWLMKKKFTILRLAATLFSVLLVCFFFWYTAIFSRIDNTRSTIAAGEVAGQSLKQMELVRIDGGRVSLGELFKKEKGAIIVFTRGAW